MKPSDILPSFLGWSQRRDSYGRWTEYQTLLRLLTCFQRTILSMNFSTKPFPYVIGAAEGKL